MVFARSLRAALYVPAANKGCKTALTRKSADVLMRVRLRREVDARCLARDSRSGNGVYDERVRGFWKDQPFVPAIDAAGRPQAATVLAQSDYSIKPMPIGTGFRMKIALDEARAFQNLAHSGGDLLDELLQLVRARGCYRAEHWRLCTAS